MDGLLRLKQKFMEDTDITLNHLALILKERLSVSTLKLEITWTGGC